MSRFSISRAVRCGAGPRQSRSQSPREDGTLATSASTGLRLVPSPERTVQVEGRADHREVREGLGEIAESLSARAGLLGVEVEMVGVAEHLLEDQPCALQARAVVPTGARERLHQPERTDVEGALLALEPVRGVLDVVTIDQAVRDQPALVRRPQGGVEGRQVSRVGRDKKKTSAIIRFDASSESLP